MRLSPDDWIFWQVGPVAINATLVFTWAVMALLVLGAWLATRQIAPSLVPGRWQGAMEAVLLVVRDQIEEIAPGQASRYLPFIATLFLFIFASNVLAVVPGFRPPTGSLSTTAALALAVLVAVPVFAIRKGGVAAYLGGYLRPSIVMLPFNLISEISRTVALAVRLYGNVMSGAVLAAILLSIAPLFFPVAMQALGLLTGVVQAYIFAVLATVYIASASPEARARIASNTKDTPHG